MDQGGKRMDRARDLGIYSVSHTQRLAPLLMFVIIPSSLMEAVVAADGPGPAAA